MVRRSKRRRRSRKPLLDARGAALFAGVAVLMFVLIAALIVPRARHQHISTDRAFALALALWLVALFAIFAIIRSRHRRHSHRHTRQLDIGTDYGEITPEELAPQTGAENISRGPESKPAG